MYFTISDFNTEQNNVSITVYINNYNKDHQQLDRAVSNILEELLGEVNYHNHIKNVDVEQLPEIPQNGFPLYELQEFVDRLKNIKPGRGRMI